MKNQYFTNSLFRCYWSGVSAMPPGNNSLNTILMRKIALGWPDILLNEFVADTRLIRCLLETFSEGQIHYLLPLFPRSIEKLTLIIPLVARI